jgi:hypothetical protein
VREQLHTGVQHLARAAAAWEGAREVLEELLLGQGMLLRWLGGAQFLDPIQASDLVHLASCMLLQQPVTVGEVTMVVDTEVACKVSRLAGLFRASTLHVAWVSWFVSLLCCGVWLFYVVLWLQWRRFAARCEYPRRSAS